MIFPSESVLIARGKYTTLSRERREQVQRVQKVCETIMHLNNQFLKDCQESPPANAALLPSMAKCLDSLADARKRIVDLSEEMTGLRGVAWEGAEE